MGIPTALNRLGCLTHFAKCSVAASVTLGMTLVLVAPASALDPEEETKLARLLANDKTRVRAIDKIVRRAKDLEPVLLGWTKGLPPGVDKYNLYFGLMEAFGRLRSKDAIPFLVDNIDWRYPVAAWHKGREAIIANSPAIAALLSIGPDATVPLMKAYNRPLTPDERMAVVFTLAQLKDPSAKEFLKEIRGRTYWELYRAEQGLALLGEKIEYTKIK